MSSKLISRHAALLIALVLFTASCNGDRKGQGTIIKDEQFDKVLVINEVMASNRTGLLTADGKTADWIEIKNISEQPVDLDGYSLVCHSKKAKKPKDGDGEDDSTEAASDSTVLKDKTSEWNFPNVTVKPGECLVVFAVKDKKKKNKDGKEDADDAEDKEENKDNNGELRANFKIPGDSCKLQLIKNETDIMAEVKVIELSADESYSRQDDGTYEKTYMQSPGFDNSREGYEAYNQRIDEQRNGSPLLIWRASSRMPKGSFNWVTVKNVSSSPVELSDYALSTKGGKKGKEWQFPAQQLAPGETYKVELAGKKAKNPATQAGFKLGDSETLRLIKGGKLIDGICLKPTYQGVTMGRTEGMKGFFFFGSDGKPRRFIDEGPTFDQTPGVYEKKKQLTLHLNKTGKPVHYTLDGSEPGPGSPVLKDTLTLTKSTVVRTYVEGDSTSLRSPVATASYILGDEHTIPVISISIKPADMWDFHSGIYANGPGYDREFPHKGANYWKNREKKAHVELFDGKEGFSTDCAFKIQGGFSRVEPKKSFQVKFYGQYGNASIKYNFFGTGKAEELERFILRGGSQDQAQCMIRDEFFTSLMAAQSPTLIVQNYRPVALYINGDYFGLYYLREKIDRKFVKQRLQTTAGIKVSDDNINMIQAIYCEEGSAAGWNRLNNYVRSHDMRNDSNYAEASQKIDVDGLIDWKLGEIYSRNTDLGNIRYVQSDEKGSDMKWHFVFYDIDASWASHWGAARYLRVAAADNALTARQNILIDRLLYNKGFRTRFLERLSHHMHNTFTEENTTRVFDNLVATITPEMKLNCKRWPQLSYKKWEKNIATFRKRFTTRNRDMLNDLRKVLSITPEEDKKYFGDLGC